MASEALKASVRRVSDLSKRLGEAQAALIAERDRAEAQVAVYRQALEGCVQSGLDEDDEAWIAVNPSGVDKAAQVLGITAASIRARVGQPGESK